MKEYHKNEYKNNKNKIDARNKEYYEDNKNKIITYKNTWYNNHKDKTLKEQKKKYNSLTYEQRRERGLRLNYNITIDDYNMMFESQKGCCAICGRHQSEEKKALHVDHDHETGKIRGLLCQKCNHGIGLFNDNPELLRKAAQFLEEKEKVKKPVNYAAIT